MALGRHISKGLLQEDGSGGEYLEYTSFANILILRFRRS